MAYLERFATFRTGPASPLGCLRSAGVVRNGHGVKRRRFDSYALVSLLAGEGRYQDEFGWDAPLVAGDWVVVFPERQHSYGPAAGQTWDEFFIVFDGPVFDLCRATRILDDERPVLRGQSSQHWNRELEGIAFEVAERAVTQSDRSFVICRLVGLLTQMLRDPPAAENWLTQAQELLSSRVEPREVAIRLGMSYETFRKRLRQELGVSPRAYLEARRIEAAKELLRSTDMTNREIAASLGFADEFHLSKRVKQATGVSPRTYRSRD